MDLQHTFTVPIGIDEAWSAFTDIERIAPCLPGATITSVEGEEFHGTAKVKLGPIVAAVRRQGRLGLARRRDLPGGDRGAGQGQARQRHRRRDDPGAPGAGG